MTDPTRTHAAAANDGATRTGVDLPTASGELGTGPFTASAPAEPASPPPPFDPPPGFSVEAELGSGGMGVVYRVRQRGLNRPVALKTVRPGVKLDAKAMIRFLAEAEAVAAVRHPNVVEVYSYGDHDGKPWLALEYCPGGDLTTLTKAEQTRDAAWFRKVAELMTGVADGVQAAHALGIVHRDLKPANVLLAADGTPKVSDFGLARRGAGADLTQTQAVMGTPAYMSPEQAGGGTKFVGPEADVWALGVMLYELACGERPIDVSGPQLEAIARVARAEVPPLRGKCPAVPKDLALIAHKCLSADPRDRYPTAGGLASDLRNWLDGKPISARSIGTIELAVKWVKRNKRLAVMGAAVLFTMAAATGISFGFGLYAGEQATDAKKAKKKSDDATERAEREVERTQRTLAKALLAPLSAREDGSGLGVYEENALWELADVRDGPVPLMVLDAATSSELTIAQFRNRAVFLDHAAVGLDTQKRRQADVLYADRSRDVGRSLTSRRDLVLGMLRADRFQEVYSMSEVLTEAMKVERNPYELGTFASGLATVAGYLPADRAARVRRMAVELLTEALGTENRLVRLSLTPSLVAAVEHLPADQAAEVLTATFAKTTDPYEREALAVGMRAVAQRLPADRAAEVYGKVADVLKARDEMDKMDKLLAMEAELEDLNARLTDMAARLPATQAAESLMRSLMTATGKDERRVKTTLAGVVSGLPRGHLALRQHPEEFAVLLGSTTLHPSVRPKPRPMPPQQLVELLKHPFCVKDARRVVLDALEFTYDRKFADLWEFVAFAEKEHPELDLLTPPKRPERK